MSKWFAGAVLSCILMISGCGGAAGPKVAPTAPVSGTVNVDGKPIEDGDITFLLEGFGPNILPVKDGKFDGKANVGENSVQIRAYKKGEPIMMNGQPFGEPPKENFVAAEFNDKTTLKQKIEAAGSKDLKFDVTSKK